MSEETLSILIGTAGLSLACLAACLIALRRRGISAEKASIVRIVSGMTVLVHLAHTIEEYHHQFYVRFPEFLGLQVWSREFFVVFNLVWVLIWTMAVVGVSQFPRVSAFPLWFLGIASIANGVVHPLVSIALMEYFPGLWSSPFVGVSGLMLVFWLAQATRKAKVLS